MSARPPAARTRLAWAGLPAHVRAAAEERAGAAVVAAHDQRGGFSPGVAARLRLEDGRRVFVKAVAPSINADTSGGHARARGPAGRRGRTSRPSGSSSARTPGRRSAGWPGVPGVTERV